MFSHDPSDSKGGGSTHVAYMVDYILSLLLLKYRFHAAYICFSPSPKHTRLDIHFVSECIQLGDFRTELNI